MDNASTATSALLHTERLTSEKVTMTVKACPMVCKILQWEAWIWTSRTWVDLWTWWAAKCNIQTTKICSSKWCYKTGSTAKTWATISSNRWCKIWSRAWFQEWANRCLRVWWGYKCQVIPRTTLSESDIRIIKVDWRGWILIRISWS